jgi:hypothetical protein
MDLDADKNDGAAVDTGTTIKWNSTKKKPSITITDGIGTVIATVNTSPLTYQFNTAGTYKYSCQEPSEMQRIEVSKKQLQINPKMSAAKDDNPEDLDPGSGNPPPPPPNTIIVSAPGGTRPKGGDGEL